MHTSAERVARCGIAGELFAVIDATRISIHIQTGGIHIEIKAH